MLLDITPLLEFNDKHIFPHHDNVITLLFPTRMFGIDAQNKKKQIHGFCVVPMERTVTP